MLRNRRQAKNTEAAQDRASMLPALIWLKEGTHNFNSAYNMIQDMRGSILSAYPPNIIIAQVPVDSMDKLSEDDSIKLVCTHEIDEEELPDAVEHGMSRFAVSAWNSRIKAELGDRDQPRPTTTTGLMWNHPGFMPPDPPGKIQERLRQRELEMQAQAEG